jgi:ABC-type phosphate transport system substrate-binding protein
VLTVGLAINLASATAVADVVAVVSAKSTVTALSKTQLEDIFLGRVSHFPNGQRAVPIDQTDGSAAREQFYTRLAGRTPAQMKAYWSKIIFTGRGFRRRRTEETSRGERRGHRLHRRESNR